MKNIYAECLALVCLPYIAHIKVCFPLKTGPSFFQMDQSRSNKLTSLYYKTIITGSVCMNIYQVPYLFYETSRPL